MGCVHSRNTNFWHPKHKKGRREIIENMIEGTDRIADILRMLEDCAKDVIRARTGESTGARWELSGIRHWENVQLILGKAAEDISHA